MICNARSVGNVLNFHSCECHGATRVAPNHYRVVSDELWVMTGEWWVINDDWVHSRVRSREQSREHLVFFRNARMNMGMTMCLNSQYWWSLLSKIDFYIAMISHTRKVGDGRDSGQVRVQLARDKAWLGGTFSIVGYSSALWWWWGCTFIICCV